MNELPDYKKEKTNSRIENKRVRANLNTTWNIRYSQRIQIIRALKEIEEP